MRGAHDDGSHGLKCLMGLRPAGGCMSYAPCGTCPVVRTTLGEARCPGWLFPVERVALVRLFLAMGGDGRDVAVPGDGEVARA